MLMSSTMRILSWKAEGLRCPDHEIDCCDTRGNPAKVSLIQMPNGTGKTTTLRLLRAALSGSARDWDHTLVTGLQKRSSDSAEGRFELRLALNEKPITVVMEFDFEASQVQYKTTWGSGQEEGFHPPVDLQRFMNEDFVNFYVFDGELAENLLDPRHTHAEKAVESLFQVHLLGRMADKVSTYWEEQTRNVTAKDETGYTRRKNRLEIWQKRHKELVGQKQDLKQRLGRIKGQLTRQEERYKREISREADRATKIETAEGTASGLQGKVRETTQQLLDNMRDPHALSPDFATAMFHLKSGLDRVKLPESAAREFFEELADEKDCVCGRPINDQIRSVIRERAQQYLGSDDVTLLNAVKSAISDAVAQSQTEAADNLSEIIDALSGLVRKSQSAQNELDELKHAAEQSDPDVMKAKEVIDRLRSSRDDLQTQLRKFEGKDEKVRLDRIGNVEPERIFSIETIEEGLQIAEDQVAEVTNTRTLRHKRDILRSIIQNTHSRASQTITAEIRNEANERIQNLMPYSDIRIDRINRCLVLKAQSGASVGETLSVGYAFLSTLFDRADQHHLPFIVDSPANPIDFDIRPSIGALVPQLTGQFIAFVISSEREKFLPSLRNACGDNIQYITLFRKGASHHETAARTTSSCVTTKDGFRVTDEQFFNDFQLDAEET